MEHLEINEVLCDSGTSFTIIEPRVVLSFWILINFVMIRSAFALL